MTTPTSEAPPLTQHVDPSDRQTSNLLASFDLTFNDHRKVILKSQKTLRCRINVQQDAYFPETEVVVCRVHAHPLEHQVTVEVSMGDEVTLINISDLPDASIENVGDKLMSLNDPADKNFERFSELLRHSGFTVGTLEEMGKWTRSLGKDQFKALARMGGIAADWESDPEGLGGQCVLGGPNISVLRSSVFTRICTKKKGESGLFGLGVLRSLGPLSSLILLKRIDCL